MSYSSLGCMAAQAFFVSLSNQQSALSIQPARSCAILKSFRWHGNNTSKTLPLMTVISLISADRAMGRGSVAGRPLYSIDKEKLNLVSSWARRKNTIAVTQ